MVTRREGLNMLGGGMVVAAMAGEAAQAAPTIRAPVAELVLEAIVEIAAMEDLGPAPVGRRRIVPITGGHFSGPLLKGKVRSGGADRQAVRADGVRQLHALYEIETDDGAVITVSNKVLVDETGPGPRYAFSNIELSAPDGHYGWLNNRVFVGTLDRATAAQGVPEGKLAVCVRIFMLM